jgi:hypothetical protein
MDRIENYIYYGDLRRKFIVDLLTSWHKTLIAYEKSLSKINELPYWNIERTNIGIFATAALRLKAVPIEEYSASKGKMEKKVGWKGRFMDSS